MILVVAGVAGVMAVCWLRPVADTVAPLVSEPAEVSNTTSVHGSYEHRQPSPGHSPRKRIVAGISRAASDETAARLAMEIHEALASNDLAARERALTNLLPALVFHNVVAAARLAETNSSPKTRGEVLRCVARHWAAQDAAGALEWASKLPDVGERDATVTDVCLKVAEVNPADAVRMRERFVLDERMDSTLENLAQQWAETDLPSALAWAGAHPAGEQRDQLLARMAFVQSQAAPVDAARLAVEQIAPGEAQDESVISVLHQWARRDLAAATAWAESFPEGELRHRALQELAGIANTRNETDAR